MYPFCSETKFSLDSVLRHLQESSSGMLDAVHLSLFAALSVETIWQKSKRWLNKMISSCCCVTCPGFKNMAHDRQLMSYFFFWISFRPYYFCFLNIQRFTHFYAIFVSCLIFMSRFSNIYFYSLDCFSTIQTFNINLGQSNIHNDSFGRYIWLNFLWHIIS